MDLVTTSDYDGAVDVLLGVGDGTFGPAQSYPTGGQARSLALGDYDDDDELDVSSRIRTEDGLAAARAGERQFRCALSVCRGINPGDMLAGDFNDDGQLDAVVQTGQYVSVLLGDGSGGFGAALQYPAGLDPGAFAAGDFDGDGNADLAVQSNSERPDFGPPGRWKRRIRAVRRVPHRPVWRRDRGGRPQRRRHARSRELQPGDLTVSVLLANGNGSFEASRSVAVPGGASVLATGFFNADSILDIATVNGGPVQILLGDPAGGYVLGGSYDVGIPATSVIAADFTNDSITDLVISSNYGYVGAWLLRGVGTGPSFRRRTASARPATRETWLPGSSTATGPSISPSRPGAAASVELKSCPETATEPSAIPSTPIRFDSRRAGGLRPELGRGTDLATTDASHNRVLVLLGNGDGTFQTPVAYPAQQGPAWLVAGWDIDEDGNTDIVVANTNSQNLSILRGLGDGTFAPGPILALGQPAVFVASGDFDGDDHYDLYTANGSGNSVSVFRGSGRERSPRQGRTSRAPTPRTR